MKKKFSLLLCSTLSLVVFCVSLLFIQSNKISPTFSTPISYGITMNSTKNKFHSYTGNVAYDGEAVIKTDLGNDVEFAYYQIKGINTTWHVLGDGGYFYNVDPIHGLQSIDLSFKTDGASYSICYSYDKSFDQIENFTSSNTIVESFDFNGYEPAYFKIINNSGSNFNISSINIALSCDNNHPIVGLISENETMGTVSGGGVKNADENITIVATPNSGYRFVGWYKDDILISTSQSYSFNVGYEDLCYVAKFTYETYNLVINSESETKGTVSDSSGNYKYLTSITINATPNDGYSFQGWYSGLNLISTSNPYSFNMPYENTTYTARFIANSYDLALNNANPLLGEISGSGTFLCGSSVTITAIPNTGVSFLGWFDNTNKLVSNMATYTFVMPHYDLEYTAKFEWTPYSVNLSINDNSMGSATGSGSYTYGQQVTLIATPNEHHSFFGWYNGIELLSQDADYSFKMPNQSMNIEARFVKNYNLNIFSEDETKGTVSGPTEWGAGLEVTITANAQVGYAIDYWYDDDLNELSYDSKYTFVMPSNDINIYASFCIGYTLTVASSDITKGTVSGGGQYKAGRVASISLNYISGIFKGWFNGTKLISSYYSCDFIMPEQDCTIEASFIMTKEDYDVAIGMKPHMKTDEMTISYGLYPQRKVSDPYVLNCLNNLTTQEYNGWYLFNEEYYATCTATPYDDNNKFSNGESIVAGETYWFKCEPIVWRIMKDANHYILLSDVLLDVHVFSERSYSGLQNGHYSNNYKHSSIRDWLNNDFYSMAFGLNSSYIIDTLVDNSAETTDKNNNPYFCENTVDKIFLFSYQDFINSDYGFSSNLDDEDSCLLRDCRTTDWSKSRGAKYYTGRPFAGSYWTRSPSSYNSFCAWHINSGGYIHNDSATDLSGYCIRPAITIDMSK